MVVWSYNKGEKNHKNFPFLNLSNEEVKYVE